MTQLREELFRLLPLVYRQRDAEPAQGGALEALLRVLGDQGDVVAADLEQLYDDLFIETCADWLVPYIGDLLGVRLLHPIGPGAGRARALVANTLDYRRRKGTVAGLEQLAFDVTGWPTAAEEYFTRLGTTQYLAHQRPKHWQAPDLRAAAELELVDGPFTATTHTAEARRIPRGRFGIANVGLHVWRLEPRRVSRMTPRPEADPPDGRYHVDPTGLPVPLFNPGVTETAITSLAQEHHVPAPLRRRALYDELEALRDGVLRRHRDHRRAHDLPHRRFRRGPPEQDHFAGVVALGNDADELLASHDEERPHVMLGHQGDGLEHGILGLHREDLRSLAVQQLLYRGHGDSSARAMPPPGHLNSANAGARKRPGSRSVAAA